MNKFLIFLSIVASLGFTPKQSETTLKGKWLLVCFTDLVYETRDCKPENDPTRDISLEFSDNGKRGILYGYTTSNTVCGEYTILENNGLRVDKFGGTKVNETGWGSNFWETIRAATSFTYRADTLVIYYDKYQKSMRFVRTENYIPPLSEFSFCVSRNTME